MRKEKVKAIIFGVGTMGGHAVKYMLDHGVEIVGAVGRKRNIGKDIGEIIGREPIGVLLENDVDAVLARVGAEADVALLTTESALEQVYLLATKCIEKRINVITIAEEAFYPWVSAPELADKLDAECKKYGVTFYASGIQDIFWSCLCTDLAAANNNISKIKSINFLPLEYMGPVVVDELYLGKTVEEYKALTVGAKSEDDPLARVSLTAIHANSKVMGLTTTSEKVSVEPILAVEDMPQPQWDMTIKKGTLNGLQIICEVQTKENITWESTLIFKVRKDESERTSIEWIIEGDPNLHLIVDDMNGDITTTTSPVNRIPDVINADPGYKTIVDLPKPIYRAFPMHTYIKE
ncbi:hypothetical protein Psfp_00155 [Pelotomaculum sp. FP]|uniref:hypothetical protein n=1 Tax=Pelotomaculum sp. FP TaxID=261474 RepID=UPI0011003ADD|nr:hypothetical protein [Pelotomaculum sp. FP]TEB18031.1 hypothetical protein Psfp_00155 [Pelotomaculum sp. FP]